MKRIILIALSCVLILSSFLLTSCDSDDPKQPNKQETQEAQTTTNTDTAAKPSGPVPVDSVNRMGAKHLFQKFMSDFKKAKSFDISMSMKSTEDGITTTEHIDIKINDTAIYIDMLIDDQAMKMWLVDNAVYVDTEEGKYKASNTGIADILGEGFLEEIMAEVPTDVPEEYLEKLEDAQIYSYEDIYYFTVTVTDDEASQMGYEEKGYRETVYFDSMGTLQKIVDIDTDSNVMTILINSYNKPVVINKPTDADEYIEVERGPENENSQEYAVYDQLCDTIDNAAIYTMYVDINENPYISYETDGQGKYVGVYNDTDNSFYEIWSVKGQGYISKDGEYPIKTDITSDILQSFVAAESMKDFITDNRIYEDDMIDLTISQGVQNSLILSFEVNTGNGTSDVYTFTFYDQMSDIHLNISSTANGQPEDIINYWFNSINDNTFELVAPI